MIDQRRFVFVRLLSVLLAFGCGRQPAPNAAQSADVPTYLRPAFHSLDSLLTDQQRDSLRALPLDSGFVYRNHRLVEYVKGLEQIWIHSPVGDTVLAHGEKAYMTDEVVLDLYHQHLRREPLDIDGALRRISPEYVKNILPHTVFVDSVLLRRDLDGSNGTDQLVREATRRPIDVGGQSPNDSTYGDTVSIGEYRLALYLDAAPLTSRPAAWSEAFDEKDDGHLERSIPLRAGGTLLVLDLAGADAVQTAIVLVQNGSAREILRHQIDYGEGAIALRDTAGAIVVDVTGDVQLGDRRVTSDIQCAPTEWPGSMLLYEESRRAFVVQRTICIRRND